MNVWDSRGVGYPIFLNTSFWWELLKSHSVVSSFESTDLASWMVIGVLLWLHVTERTYCSTLRIALPGLLYCSVSRGFNECSTQYCTVLYCIPHVVAQEVSDNSYSTYNFLRYSTPKRAFCARTSWARYCRYRYSMYYCTCFALNHAGSFPHPGNSDIRVLVSWRHTLE